MRYFSFFMLAAMTVAFVGCGGSGIKNGTTASTASRDNPRRSRVQEEADSAAEKKADDSKAADVKKSEAPADEKKADETKKEVTKADDEAGLTPEELEKKKMNDAMLATQPANGKIAQLMNRTKDNKAKDKKPDSGGRGLVMDINNIPEAAKNREAEKAAARGQNRSKIASAATGQTTADSDAKEEEVIKVDPNGSYLEAAKNSFLRLSEEDAVQYLYAHALTADEGLSKYPLSWVPSISEPRLAVRWGVAVIYSAPSDFEGQPPVVGDGIAEKTTDGGRDGGRGSRGGARGGARGGGGQSPLGGGFGNRSGRGGSDSEAPKETPYANVDTSTPNGALLYYTGDFGERLLRRLDMRRGRSFYGEILKEMPAIEQKVTKEEPQNARGGSAPGGNKRNILAGGPPQAGSNAPRGRDNSNDNDNADFAIDEMPLGTLQPGIMLIGHGIGKSSEKDLVKKAADMGIDFLVCIHVSVEERSNQGPYSSTYASITSCKNPDDFRKKCASLNNETVYKAREKQKDETKDKVEMALDRLFADFADKKGLRTEEMKKLPTDAVEGRVLKISNMESDNPLPQLLEIAFYYSQGMASEDMAVAAMGKLVGDDNASKLLSGSEKEKREVIKEWMPSGGASDSGEVKSSVEFR